MKMEMRKRSIGKARRVEPVVTPLRRCVSHSKLGTPQSSLASREAMTLVELLIVIVIIATLTAAALPVLTPTTEARRIRETSRTLNTYITQAQSKAIATRRPYGIALKRLSSETGNDADRGVCLEVVPVQVPVPYAGFDENSRMRAAINSDPNYPGTVVLDFITRGNNEAPNTDSLPLGWDADLVPPNVLRLGDVVEVLGNRFRIVNPYAQMTQNNGYLSGHQGARTTPRPAQVVAQPINNTGQVIEPVYGPDGTRLTRALLRMAVANQQQDSRALFWTEPAPYKVHRQPVPTSADPYQLPDGAAIDLEASGIVGELPFHYSDGDNNPELLETVSNAPVYIMFSPEGNVERVQFERVQRDVNDNLVSAPLLGIPSANIALLIGRRENIPADTTLDLTSGTETEREVEKAKLNWLNLESQWVMIGAQSGSVVTTENAFVNTVQLQNDIANNQIPDRVAPGGIDPIDIRLEQISRAQEFAREMRRTTGG